MGDWCYPVLISALKLDPFKVLRLGVFAGWKGVYASLSYVGIADFETQWN